MFVLNLTRSNSTGSVIVDETSADGKKRTSVVEGRMNKIVLRLVLVKTSVFGRRRKKIVLGSVGKRKRRVPLLHATKQRGRLI
jgi:hypothetical protein